MSNPNQRNHLLPIHNLPSDIVENILTFLPIKGAIVASTIAQRFKTSWHRNRRFLFGREFSTRYGQLELATMVDHMFNSHHGEEIKTLRLHIDPIGIEALLKKWLNICVKKDIEELELYFFRLGFTIEFSVLDGLHKLKTLKLINCEIQLLKDPVGLRFLHTLNLWKLNLTQEMFDILISHCKMLETLDLYFCLIFKKMKIVGSNNKQFKKLRIAGCRDLVDIKIDSSTLSSFFYHGKLPRIQFVQAMRLYEAYFYIIPSRNYIQPAQLEALANDFSKVAVLTTSSILIEALSARFRDGIFREAEYNFFYLRELQLFMEGGMFCNPYDIYLFLKRCPSLQKLFIDLDDYQFECGVYWELHQKHQLNTIDHLFTRLQFVVLKNFKFMDHEIELVKMILERASILDKLYLIPPKSGRYSKLEPDLAKYDKYFQTFKIASKNFGIDYKEHCVKFPTHSKCWFHQSLGLGGIYN